jgi:hypothetical protein
MPAQPSGGGTLGCYYCQAEVFYKMTVSAAGVPVARLIGIPRFHDITPHTIRE